MTKDTRDWEKEKEKFLSSCNIKGKFGETMLNDLLDQARKEGKREGLEELVAHYGTSRNRFILKAEHKAHIKWLIDSL